MIKAGTSYRLLWICLMAIMALTTIRTRAQSKPPPDKEPIMQTWFGQMQYGGNMGLISVGIGKYFFGDNFLLSLHYGQTSSGNEGSKTISSFSLKNTFIPVSLDISKKFLISPELGWAITSSGESPLPLLMFAGMRLERNLHHSFLSRLGIFFQIGTSGMWLHYAADNSDVDLNYLYNFSTGLQVNF